LPSSQLTDIAECNLSVATCPIAAHIIIGSFPFGGTDAYSLIRVENSVGILPALKTVIPGW
jgi:hypothetical protein